MLDGHALQTGCADKSHRVGVFANIGSILWGENWPTVGEDHDIIANRMSGVTNGLSRLNGVIHGNGGAGYANLPTNGAADMGNDDVGSGFGHAFGFIGRDDVWNGE